jgi:hypothetical protein
VAAQRDAGEGADAGNSAHETNRRVTEYPHVEVPLPSSCSTTSSHSSMVKLRSAPPSLLPPSGVQPGSG